MIRQASGWVLESMPGKYSTMHGDQKSLRPVHRGGSFQLHVTVLIHEVLVSPGSRTIPFPPVTACILEQLSEPWLERTPGNERTSALGGVLATTRIAVLAHWPRTSVPDGRWVQRSRSESGRDDRGHAPSLRDASVPGSPRLERSALARDDDKQSVYYAAPTGECDATTFRTQARISHCPFREGHMLRRELIAAIGLTACSPTSSALSYSQPFPPCSSVGSAA